MSDSSDDDFEPTPPRKRSRKRKVGDATAAAAVLAGASNNDGGVSHLDRTVEPDLGQKSSATARGECSKGEGSDSSNEQGNPVHEDEIIDLLEDSPPDKVSSTPADRIFFLPKKSSKASATGAACPPVAQADQTDAHENEGLPAERLSGASLFAQFAFGTRTGAEAGWPANWSSRPTSGLPKGTDALNQTTSKASTASKGTGSSRRKGTAMVGKHATNQAHCQPIVYIAP